jgi:hypothetical protein
LNQKMILNKRYGGIIYRLAGCFLLLAAWSCSSTADLESRDWVSTVAGNGKPGFSDGAGSGAVFTAPAGVGVDQDGMVYVADTGNNRIRKIGPGKRVTTVAGSGAAGNADGAGPVAEFNLPRGLAVDFQGNVYVADFGNGRIRVIDPMGTVTTLAGSTGLSAPWAVAVDGLGNCFVIDGNRVVSILGGSVTVIAGTAAGGNADGPGPTARFNHPAGIAADATGNLYVADMGNNTIREISTSGNVSTFAGAGNAGYLDGPLLTALFNGPSGVAVDAEGSIWVTETGNNDVRKITNGGYVLGVVGYGAGGYDDGPALTARFLQPSAIALDSHGNAFIADTGNNYIREIN